MFGRNQFFSDASLNRAQAQAPNSSSYFQPSRYQSMQANSLAQQAPRHQSISYQSSQAHDASRFLLKQTSSQQVDSLQSASSQNLSWMTNGAPSMQQLPQSHYQPIRQWHHTMMQGDRLGYGAAGTNQSGLINHTQITSTPVLDYSTTHTIQANRIQSTQLSTAPQTSKVLIPSASHRTSSISDNLPVPRIFYPAERVLSSSRPAIQRSNSSSNNRIQDPNSLMHSQPSMTSSRIANVHGNMSQHFGIDLLPPPQSKKTLQQPERRDKIHIRFDQKSKTLSKPLPRNIATQRLSKESDSESSLKDEETPGIVKTPVVLENKTRIVIDDDIEIVGTKEAEIMSHIRSDCPLHPYVRIESVDTLPNASNLKYCSKCFCYICDKLAEHCKLWNEPFSPHCNANTKSSCWKARRNIKKSPLMNRLTPDETTKEMIQAGDIAVGYTIRVRESYIDYRNGIPCEFHSVPCECACHNKLSKDVCAQCKAVHDMKKKFNYDPVRQVILKIFKEIQKEFSTKPYSALILYEALLAELCSHRPADFNHVTRMPSNPDPKCQCNTPQIMDEYLDWELIQIFTIHEVQAYFKEKFLSCVNASLQPLQLKDIMKRFLQMRHWDDPVLRSVFMGNKHGDSLKELPLVIEMRMKKLSKENKFVALLHYLKAVKVSKVQVTKNCTSDGVPILAAIEMWTMECLAKLGYFKDACTQLATLIRKLPVNFVLNLFSLLSGKDLPPATELILSFNKRRSGNYKIEGMDRTFLFLTYLMFMEVNTSAQSNFACYLWLAKWLNEETVICESDKAILWMQESTKLLEWSRTVFALPTFLQHLLQAPQVSPQTALFTCSSLITRFLRKASGNMTYILNVIEAYKANEWALFYMFSQPALLSCGNHDMITWMTDFMKRIRNNLSHFSPDAFTSLMMKNSFTDVCLFMQQWISPMWVDASRDFMAYFLQICATFAQRILSEISNKPSSKLSISLDWFSEEVLQKLFHSKVELNNRVTIQYCELIGRSCCYLSIKNICFYKQLSRLVPREADSNAFEQNLSQILLFYRDQFNSGELCANEIVELVQCAIESDNTSLLSIIFDHYVEKHQCPDPSDAAYLVMERVISIINSPQEQLEKKENLVALYTKLCAHEALSWLICAKCSANMPVKWMEVWKALAANSLLPKVYEVVETTLQLFVTWIKDLSALEENDMKRLLHCLESFFSNVARTLIEHCAFNEIKLQETILRTGSFMANQKLQHDFRGIIHRIFDAVRSARISTTSSQVRIEQVVKTNENHRTITSPQRTSTSAQLQTTAIPSSPLKEQTIHSPPTTTHMPLKLTISKSRLSTGSNAGKPTTPVNEKSMLSPVSSPTTICPKCGDPMTSSFRCSKCQSRKTKDVRCPSCNQINSDVKGYSCRYCYASLLEVLTSGESVAPESSQHSSSVKPEPPQPSAIVKSSSEKKRKKLKRKKSESLNVSDSLRNTTEKAHSGTSTVNSKAEEKVASPPPKNLLVHEPEYSVKSVTTTTGFAKTSHKSAISKIPVDDLIPQPPKPHQRVKEAQRKERPSMKSTNPKRVHIMNTMPKSTPNLSDSDSDSDSDTSEPTQVPRLILRRKTETEPAPVVAEQRKSLPVEGSHVTKRVASQGSSMSKKQRNILQRMKNVGRVKPIPKQTKKAPKSPAASPSEWEVQNKRRKPGPKSRTAYYTVHSSWDIPRTEPR